MKSSGLIAGSYCPITVSSMTSSVGSDSWLTRSITDCAPMPTADRSSSTTSTLSECAASSSSITSLPDRYDNPARSIWPSSEVIASPGRVSKNTLYKPVSCLLD